MTKKILYIGGFELPDKNAAAQRVMSNAKLLREMGFDVLFIGISKDIKNAPTLVDGFASHPVVYPNNKIQWIRQIFSFIKEDAVLRVKPQYVVLYNFPSFASLKILRLCHKHGIKVVHDLTEWEISTGWSLREVIRKIDIVIRMHYCIKRMDAVMAISKFLYDYYKTHTYTVYVPPTIDLKANKWNRNREFEPSKQIRFVYAGNAGFGVKDRLDIIIRAIGRFVNMTLDIVGMTADDFEKRYGTLPDTYNNIVFHGRTSHQNAIKVVQNSDFQFLIRDSNIKNNAGFPTKFVESMACCTPVVATLTSNIGDYLKNGENGFIVDENQSLDDVLKCIGQLSFEEIRKMKEACRSVTVFDYRQYKDVFGTIFR